MARKKKQTTEDFFKGFPERLEELAKHNPWLLEKYETSEERKHEEPDIETPPIMKVELPKYDTPCLNTNPAQIKEDTMYEPYKKSIWHKLKKTASTIALAGGVVYGVITLYQGLTLEDTVNEHNGQEYIMKFEPNEKRALPYQVSMENHTYSRLRDLILRMEDDQKKPFSEQDIYNLVLRMNTENFSKLDLSEVETAWRKYEIEKSNPEVKK